MSNDRIGVRTTADETVVSLEDVTVQFDDEEGFLGLSKPNPVRAVDGVSLDIGENDVVALVGESGCGKTTLGKTAIGVHRPTSGSVKFRGQDIWDAKDGRGDVEIPYKEIRRGLQIIHQDPSTSLNPNKTVRHTLSKPLKRVNPDESSIERRRRINKLLERVGMTPGEDFASRFPHQLSGGEKQRVSLIRALVMNPDLILADEAVSALDVSLRIDMMDLMLDLQAEVNTSYLFISHNLSNASYLAGKADGRLGIMYLGELVEFGPVDEVLQNPQHPYTKALTWATPNLDPDIEEDETMPLRRIDVPDVRNPPSGCPYHTRCPEAREACRSQTPDLDHEDSTADHSVACFRAYDDHEYWSSPEIMDGSNESRTGANETA